MEAGYSYWTAQRLLSWWVEGYWPTRVQGAEHVPRTGAVILAGNHPTVLDGLILALHAPRRVRFLVRGDVMSLPVLGPFLRRLGSISVQRGGLALQQAQQALHREFCIGIFPEADPSFSLQLRPFRRGAAVLAQSSGASLVPFAVRNTERYCGARARSARPGPVLLQFGAPIVPVSGESPEDLTERLREAVAELLEQPQSGPAQGPGWGLRWLTCSCFFRPSSAAMLALSARRISPPPSRGPEPG